MGISQKKSEKVAQFTHGSTKVHKGGLISEGYFFLQSHFQINVEDQYPPLLNLNVQTKFNNCFDTFWGENTC